MKANSSNGCKNITLFIYKSCRKKYLLLWRPTANLLLFQALFTLHFFQSTLATTLFGKQSIDVSLTFFREYLVASFLAESFFFLSFLDWQEIIT